MSYDTWIEADPCIACGHDPGIEIGNMTSNVGAMYRRAMPGPYDGGGLYNGDGANGNSMPRGGLPGISGLRTKDALPILTKGIEYMREHEDEMRALEPANGWGNYEGALEYLKKLHDACERLNGVVCVNW